MNTSGSRADGPLLTYRQAIDDLDQVLVDLLQKRFDIVKQIAVYKKNQGLPTLDSDREASLLSRLEGMTSGAYQGHVGQVFKQVMKISRGIQDQIRGGIGYAGVRGAYAEEAALAYFKVGQDSLKDYPSFAAVAHALREGQIAYGLMPIENSTTGAIREVYDLLRQHGLFIRAEVCLSIDHILIGHENARAEDIDTVYSHHQGHDQCSTFLAKKPYQLVTMANTAMSVQQVAMDGKINCAAIGSARAAQVYGLKVLAKGIQNSAYNTTRFVILCATDQYSDEANTTSIVITTPHETGALFKVLKVFADHNINLLRIESRPIPDQAWHYYMYIDLCGHVHSQSVKGALEKVQDQCDYFQVLGSYKRQVKSQN